MRAARWLGGLGLVLGLTSLSEAQQAVSFNGSFSGTATRNVPLDTSRLSTPLPPVPQRPGKSRLFNLFPSFMSLSSLIPTPGLRPTGNPYAPQSLK
jgi:hypothetical protein